MGELGAAWRVVRAGWTKNWRLSTTYPSWVLNRLLGPLVWVALAVYSYTGLAGPERVQQAFVDAGEGASFTGFLILGQTLFAFFTGINWRGGMAIQRERWQGTLEMVLLAPTSRVAFVLGESLFGLLDSGWTVFLAMVLAMLLFGVQFHVAHPEAVVLAVGLTLLAMVALGLFFAGFYVLTRAAGPLSQAVQAPVGFLAGVQFPVQALPGALQAVSYALPVTFGLAAVRGAVLQGQGLDGQGPALLALVAMSVVFAAAGAVLIRRMEARAKREGTIHAY
ncbi:MAG TPA: ABC transporter permease [Candidatus Thermoplasmatota archaeon]|jgi:ABC-2 type transport system permease protein|nr:ABC transporter permease [Candidatus Thermoplasmatota archaeon]